MRDIIERLLEWPTHKRGSLVVMQPPEAFKVRIEAATEITRLRERLAEADECNRRVSDENEKLREALKPFADDLEKCAFYGACGDNEWTVSAKHIYAAAAAIRESGE